jgi:hypothetical protein
MSNVRPTLPRGREGGVADLVIFVYLVYLRTKGKEIDRIWLTTSRGRSSISCQGSARVQVTSGHQQKF